MVNACGSAGAGRHSGNQPIGQRHCPGVFAGRRPVDDFAQPAPPGLVVVGGRGEPHCVGGQFGGHGRRAALRRSLGDLVEMRGDRPVGQHRRRCKVAGGGLGRRDDVGEPEVDRLSVQRIDGIPHRGCVHRVREPHSEVVGDADDAGGDRRSCGLLEVDAGGGRDGPGRRWSGEGQCPHQSGRVGGQVQQLLGEGAVLREVGESAPISRP